MHAVHLSVFRPALAALLMLGAAPVLALDVSGFSQYYEFPQEDFFGFGMDSQESDRTNYRLDATERGGLVRWRPLFLDLAAGGSYISPRTGHGTDDRFPSTEQRFRPATMPGLGTRTDVVTLEASAAIDWRDNPAHPHAGGRNGVTAARFNDRDLNQYDFHRIDVSLQQYVPLTDRYRILALRAEGCSPAFTATARSWVVSTFSREASYRS
jgi:hypothetical protein